MKTCKHPTCKDECRRTKAPKKVKLTPLPKLLKKVEVEFNRFIRLRDQGLNCISCNKPGDQAGHYFPVGFSGVRFDEDNVHIQETYCNKWKYGNPHLYRINLVKKIGEKRVKALEERAVKTKSYKWSREELNQLLEKYKELNKGSSDRSDCAA